MTRSMETSLGLLTCKSRTAHGRTEGECEARAHTREGPKTSSRPYLLAAMELTCDDGITGTSYLLAAKGFTCDDGVIGTPVQHGVGCDIS